MAFVKLADNYTVLIGKFAVALLAEGVDRNQPLRPLGRANVHVALLAEGVDRNPQVRTLDVALHWSPSSRRAWIEIFIVMGQPHPPNVALLAEGVDRNCSASHLPAKLLGRPPRGGRG